MSKKQWLTLTSHGKNCLEAYVCALSGTDIKTSQMDYLWDKDLVAPVLDFKDSKGRMELAGKCLTDLGVETVKHYFPEWI